MQLLINGEPREVPNAITAASLLELMDLAGKRLALEINQEILPRGQFTEFQLNPDDRVEIIHAIGGG